MDLTDQIGRNYAVPVTLRLSLSFIIGRSSLMSRFLRSVLRTALPVLACSAVLASPARAATSRAAAESPTWRFDIAAGSLGAALDAFRQVTGATVIVPAGAPL